MSDEFAGPDIEKLRKAADLMPVKERLEKYRKIDRISLHPKQAEFVELGATHRETALLGSNQCGKSTVGAYVLAHHLMGDYPADWRGSAFRQAGERLGDRPDCPTRAGRHPGEVGRQCRGP